MINFPSDFHFPFSGFIYGALMLYQSVFFSPSRRLGRRKSLLATELWFLWLMRFKTKFMDKENGKSENFSSKLSLLFWRKISSKEKLLLARSTFYFSLGSTFCFFYDIELKENHLNNKKFQQELRQFVELWQEIWIDFFCSSAQNFLEIFDESFQFQGWKK